MIRSTRQEYVRRSQYMWVTSWLAGGFMAISTVWLFSGYFFAAVVSYVVTGTLAYLHGRRQRTLDQWVFSRLQTGNEPPVVDEFEKEDAFTLAAEAEDEEENRKQQND